MKITCFEGDGIGPEITNSVLRILDTLNLDLEFEKYPIGQTAYNICSKLIPDEAIESIKKIK